MREWRCSCGAAFGEPGDGSGLKAAKGHQVGKTGHRITGLYADAGEDAEILVVGPKNKVAADLGYIVEPPSPPTEEEDEKAPKRPKGSKGDDNNMLVGIPFARINLPPAIWGWISLTMPKMRTAEDMPYGDDNEGVGRFLYDCVEFVGMTALAMEYHVERDAAIIQHIAKKLRGEIRPADVAVVTQAAVPDVPYTTTESVLEDIVPLLRQEARKMAERYTQKMPFSEEDHE